MMALPSELLAQAGQLLPEAVHLRRRLHASPEIGLDLPQTTAAVLDASSGMDLEISRSRFTSGFVATLRGAHPGPGLLLRADMDALPMPEDTGLEFSSRQPGKMHACGHDAHTAMLAGAARLLDRHRDRLHGQVHLLFQPGEEGWFGARLMIEEGLVTQESMAAAFAIHIDPRLPRGVVTSKPGALMAAADVWTVEIKGRGGHASMPHDAIDPIPVACEIVHALNSFVTRRIDAFDPVVLTVTKIEAGTTNNVIPESAHMVGTLRSFSERARRRAQEGIRRIATNVAAAHEVTAEANVTPGYPVTVNDESFVGFVRGVVSELLGAGSYREMAAPVMGAEDFSYVLQLVPGAMVFLGARPQDVTAPAPCHSNRMVLDEEAMTNGISLHAAVAMRFLAG
jgi:amidohydrolase